MATGEHMLVTPWETLLRPYGIVLDGEGHPWVSLFNVDRLVRIHPETLEMSHGAGGTPTRPGRVTSCRHRRPAHPRGGIRCRPPPWSAAAPMNLAVSVAIGLTFLGSAMVTIPNLVVELVRRGSPQVVFSVETPQRVVALSIDDGPSPMTPEILSILDAHGAKATFFVIGDRLEMGIEVARAIVEGGHELGHHMMEDVPSRGLPADVFQERFQEMHELLEPFGGASLFRPGSGWYNDRMLRTAESRGYRTVLGSVYPFDAHLSWTPFLSWFVLQNTGPGSILVLHDGADRGLRTAEVLREVLPELGRRGYQVVTVSTLLALEEDSPPAGAR